MVEYKVVSYGRNPDSGEVVGSKEDLEQKLNEFSQYGWELVSLMGDLGTMWGVWKKM